MSHADQRAALSNEFFHIGDLPVGKKELCRQDQHFHVIICFSRSKLIATDEKRFVLQVLKQPESAVQCTSDGPA